MFQAEEDRWRVAEGVQVELDNWSGRSTLAIGQGAIYLGLPHAPAEGSDQGRVLVWAVTGGGWALERTLAPGEGEGGCRAGPREGRGGALWALALAWGRWRRRR